jgi:two-component system sensor histidine kinase AlgZ
VLLGALVGAGSAFEALSAMGPALMVALPATLLWLGLTCSLRRQIVRARPLWRVLALTSLGALLAWLASVPVVALGLMEFQPLRAISLPLVGAAFALPLTLWLQSRERRRTPADASARLAELQSRIRPHFLFNTLNTAIALVRSDPARAENVLEDLAELFRVALEQDGSARGSSSVTLADEIELATWRSSRCDSASACSCSGSSTRRPTRHGCRRWCCSRSWRTRCAMASSRPKVVARCGCARAPTSVAPRS